MKASELSIGDIVLVNNEKREVESITKHKIGYHLYKNECNMHYVRLCEIQPLFVHKQELMNIIKSVKNDCNQQEEIDYQRFKTYLENNRTNYPDFMSGTDSYAFGMREGYTMAFDKIISNF